VLDEEPDALRARQAVIPTAEVARKNFWQSPARGHLIGELNLPTACQ
jgi:hypothetical protein